MLQENLYEILAFIIILTLIVIYFLTRNFRQEEINSLLNNAPKDNSKETKSTQILEEKIYEDTLKNEEENFTFLDLEEGSFGNIIDNPFEKTSQDTTQKKKTKKRTKREVPSHGKISKENFKEFKGVKLLVAEDNIINQKVIYGLLSGSGIEITMAENGQVTLDILEKNHDFDMILMDARMPKINGLEATRKIRANEKYADIVIIALSGDISPEDINKMLDAGMEEHLEKPLKMNAFYDILYAYTKGIVEKNEFIEIAMTKELDAVRGLEVCGGDDIFYKDILNDFIQNYTNISHELTKLLDENNEILADAILLDFIGITANIGAQNIQDVAIKLKETIADIEEKSYITLLEEFEQHLQILLADIKKYI